MKSIIFIVGPTAVGKTRTSLLLAHHLKGEVVSCDAMQVYREINIASAKPSAKELKSIAHHCVNIVSVSQDFDVAKYRKLAVEAIEDIHKRNKTPIIVGGSGMYMSILLDGIFEDSAHDDQVRKSLEQEIKTQGSKTLHDRLKELDSKAALKIHSNDAKRIVRALEVIAVTGKPFSQLQKNRQGIWQEYPIKIFGLERPRTELYKNAEHRIDEMFQEGLVDEVKSISKQDLSLTAKTLLGIPEVQGFLKGDYDLEQAKHLMKLNTRHYIKRQMTWFRRDERITWIKMGSSVQEAVDEIISKLS